MKSFLTMLMLTLLWTIKPVAASNFTIEEAIELCKAKCSVYKNPPVAARPTIELKEEIEKKLGQPLPKDLWTFYEACWNYETQNFEIFSFINGAKSLFISQNEAFKKLPNAPQIDVAFAEIGRGNFYYTFK